MPCHPDRVRLNYFDVRADVVRIWDALQPGEWLSPASAISSLMPANTASLTLRSTSRIPERRATFEALIPDRYKPA